MSLSLEERTKECEVGITPRNSKSRLLKQEPNLLQGGLSPISALYILYSYPHGSSNYAGLGAHLSRTACPQNNSVLSRTSSDFFFLLRYVVHKHCLNEVESEILTVVSTKMGRLLGCSAKQSGSPDDRGSKHL
jgi:hypothetical protein